jgi:hypothetical protein
MTLLTMLYYVIYVFYPRVHLIVRNKSFELLSTEVV